MIQKVPKSAEKNQKEYGLYKMYDIHVYICAYMYRLSRFFEKYAYPLRLEKTIYFLLYTTCQPHIISYLFLALYVYIWINRFWF